MLHNQINAANEVEIVTVLGTWSVCTYPYPTEHLLNHVVDSWTQQPTYCTSQQPWNGKSQPVFGFWMINNISQIEKVLAACVFGQILAVLSSTTNATLRAYTRFCFAHCEDPYTAQVQMPWHVSNNQTGIFRSWATWVGDLWRSPQLTTFNTFCIFTTRHPEALRHRLLNCEVFAGTCSYCYSFRTYLCWAAC